MLYLLLLGCSVSRRSKTLPPEDFSAKTVSPSLVASCNVANTGFFITKAFLEITGEDETQKALCSVKHNGSGEYLITVRSRSGIEAGRMFINRDTLLINDRINRILYYGSPGRLSEKYGIAYYLIPLIFGDYISMDADSADLRCLNGVIRKRELVYGNPVNYIIDCRNNKVIEAITGSANELKLVFRSFKVDGGKKYPAKIEIEHVSRNIKLKIAIENIESDWDESIDFVPGSNYKKMPIL